LIGGGDGAFVGVEGTFFSVLTGAVKEKEKER
jgi:hypothetical protein